jgi:hypothetical protein
MWNQRKTRKTGGKTSLPNNLHEDSFSSSAVKLPIKNLFPWAQIELSLCDSERLDLVHGFIEGAKENDLDVLQLLVCLEPATHFVAIHFRHHDIEKDQVRRVIISRL